MPDLDEPWKIITLTDRGKYCNRPNAQQDPVPEPDGSLTDHLTKQPIGSWTVTGATTKICLFGECASCTTNKPIGSDPVFGCYSYTCDPYLTSLHWTDSLTLKGVGNQCVSANGVTYGRDGKVTAKGLTLGTWSGSYSSLRFCTADGACAHCAP